MRWLLEARLAAPGRLRAGLLLLAGIGVAYAGCILLLALGGARPNPAPWLRIADAGYFYWEAAFIAPVMCAGGVLAAACLHLLARAAGGEGSFDDTLALVGPAVAACTLTTVVPDTGIGLALVTGALRPETWMAAITRPTWVLAVVWVYLLLYLAAFAVAFPLVAQVVHGLRPRAAVACGWAAFVVYQVFLFVFIR